MKLREIIDETLLIEKKSKHNNKKPKKIAEGNKHKDGRERLVSTICNKIKEMGGKASRQEVKNYEVHMYKLWERKSSEVQWLLDLEKRAVELGFNPRDYKDQEPGDSAGGIGAPGGKEYDGRAFFFVALTDTLAKHFVNKYNSHKGKNGDKK